MAADVQRGSSTRPVLARRSDVASTRAVAAPPAGRYCLRTHAVTNPFRAPIHARAQMLVSARASRSTCSSPKAGTSSAPRGETHAWDDKRAQCAPEASSCASPGASGRVADASRPSYLAVDDPCALRRVDRRSVPRSPRRVRPSERVEHGERVEVVSPPSHLASFDRQHRDVAVGIGCAGRDNASF